MRWLYFVFTLHCLSPLAHADLIFDFEDKQGLTGLASLTYSNPELTLTITRSSGTVFDIDAPGAAPFLNGSLSPFNGNGGAAVDDVFHIELSQPVAAIFVEVGDFGGDADEVILQGYLGSNLSGTSFEASGTLPGGGSSFRYLNMQLTRSPFEPGFRSFALRGGSVEFPNSVYFDNFVFRLSAVPEPNAAFIAFLGISLCGLVRHRSRTKPRPQSISS